MSQHERTAGAPAVKPEVLPGRKRLPLVPVSRTEPLPLSFMQQRLWFLAQLEGTSSTYNVHFFVRLKGPLDVAALRRAVADIVQRHEALRTTFAEVNGQPVQRVTPALSLPVPVEELEPAPGETREAAVRRRAEEEARHRFDLEAGPLVRATLLRVAEEDHVLLFVTHHIVCDAVSFYWMAAELNTLYLAHALGEEPRLPALQVQYADFAHWQREWLQGEVLEAQRTWWTERLEGAPPVLELPTDRPRPPAQTFRGTIVPVPLPATLPAAVRELARKAGATPYMTMLAGFGALLSRYSGQSDLVVGTPFAGRSRREVEKLIGFFANTLALRLDASGELSFLELLRRTREGCLAAFARPDMPFEQLVDALVPVRDASRSPLFQVMFVHVGTPLSALKWPGITVEEVAYEPGVARFDITLFFYEDAGGWVCRWEYNRDLFDEATILRMAAHYSRLLEAACANPMETVSRLPLLTDEERHQVLREWNDTATPYPSVPTVHSLFEATAARTPDAIAASFGDSRLSYAELNRRANQLAHHLRSLGVVPDSLVGICAERSLDLPVAVLGTLKAGGAYVPLDPAYPPERLAAMLQVSGARVLLTQSHLRHVLPDSSATTLTLDDSDVFSRHPTSNPPSSAGPESLTYVIFTSGSTGTPKGVAMHHTALVNLLLFQCQSSSVPSGTTLQFSAFSFDVSFQEMLATWTGGGELVLIPEELRRDAHALLQLMDSCRVERLFLPFVALQNLAEVSEQDSLVPRHLREIITAGEQLRMTPALRLLLKRLPGAVLHNQYGPTETHLATLCVLSGDADTWPDLPLIGTPIANASVHLLDSHLQPVPVGVPGELYIGGLQVARGYWGRPDLTVERFLPDAFSTRPGARMYRTGDQARYRPNGAIEFLGRRDAQVKVRGFRIELGEIEAALARHPSVRDCVVAAREESPGQRRLVAWVVGVEGQAPETDALKAFLKQRLPEYMVPSAWVLLDTFPLTPSGKVDRKALPEPGQEEHEAYVAPRTETEALVARIWAPLLKLPRVGAHDHFFERGGHSLLATQVASRLRSALGVEFPVRVLFEAPTVAELAERLDAMPRSTGAVRPPPLVPTPRDGELPLSFSQQRLWFIAQLDAGGFSYNVPFVFRLEGRLDAAALEQGLRELTRRHEVLRTTFAQVEGRPVQRIAPEPVLRLAVEDVSTRPEELARRAREEAQRPFDLAVGPLVRATLLRAAEDEHVLLLVMHHIVCDGWSLGVLLRELKALYAAALTGEPPALAPLPVQYADFARWQRDWLKGDVLEAQLTWWKGQLAGAPALLELPADRPRPPVQGFRGALMQVPLPEAMTDAIREVCRSEDVTPFMLLLASFHALLARYSGQPDLVVGTPIAGRTQRELEDLVGFFVNTLALRLDASGDPSFREWLGRVRETSLGAFAHQDVPFEKLVDAVQPARDLSRSPLFQVMFVLQEAPPTVALPGLSLGLLDIDPGVATFDLTLYMRETARGWVGFWEYNTDLFDEATVARMAAHHARLLEAACAEPSRRLSSLPLLTDAERRRLLADWNAPATQMADATCLHVLFEAQAARTPDAVALDSETGRLTYRELNARANQLAHHLARRGVRVGDVVGVLLERSLEALVSLLGVLKAGAAYLPLDPAYPRERLEYMLADSGATRLLTHAGVLARTGALGVEVLDVEALRADVAREADTNLHRAVPAESLAYLIYTSGSTGKPKAVMTPHRAVSAYSLGNASIYALTSGDRTLQFSTLSFDQSVEEIFPALLTGGTAVLRTEAMLDPAAFCERCEQWGITVLFLPTAFWAELTASLVSGAVRLPPSVRVVGIGGEKVPASRVQDWQRVAPAHVRLTNEYGPTETTVICVVGDLGPVPEAELRQGRVPIGRASPGVRACVLDAWMQPVPAGLPGELYVGGIILAHGYLGRPELTAERFAPDPFSAEPGARLYRTGDLVRSRPDGTLEYVGRADDQVKLRGFRVELGEIDAALRRSAGVRDVTVVVREPTPGDKRLVAYVVPEPGTEVRSSRLRAELRSALPEYMVPSAFVLMDALPLTPSGKVDRKALPAPREEAEREGYIAPRAGLEEVVANIWAPLLGVKRVGAHDNFFELGGHSLLATQVVSRLREVLQREVPVRLLFEAPTVAELSRRLESSREDAGPPPPPLVPVSRDVAPPLSFAQQRLWFLARLDAGGFAYNVPFFLRLRGPLDVTALERGLTDLVQRHESLRTTFVEVDGEPVQRISARGEIPFTVESLEAASEQAIRQRAEAEVRRPFDLEHGPLVRATLLRTSANEHVLLFVMHHIVCDFWSSDVLVRELKALYGAHLRGEDAALPELPVQYADFAHWQRRWLQGEVLEAERTWWKAQLAGAPPVLELPTDRPRPAVQTFRGAQLHHRLPAELPGAAHELSREAGITPFMLLMAGFHALLARYSRQPDIVVGTPIAGRNRREVEGLIGFFTNTLALRVNASGDVSFRELLRRVREACLGAYAHQDMPFEQLVDALVPVRDVSRTPLFQVMFVFQQGSAAWELPGMEVEELVFEPGMAKFDLTLFVRETPSGWTSLWEYNTDLFDEATVARMAAHYARLLEGALASPERKLSTLPLLAEAEQQPLAAWTGKAVPYPFAPTVHAFFEATVARSPDAIAVRFGEESLTYGELNRRANQLAHHLRARGVGTDTLVGVCVQRSLDLPVAVLGTLKAGGAYVPLDPAYPAERLALMLKTSGAKLLITQHALRDALSPGQATPLYLDLEGAALARERDDDPSPMAGPESLTYVIFTSGSTGLPKGVALHHGALVNLLHWQLRDSVAPSGRTLQFSALSFDVSFQEMFSTWAAGGELVLLTEEVRRDAHALLELLERAGIERLFLPFVALQNLAETAEREGLTPSRLREIMVAGEQLRMTPALRRLMARLGAVLHNHYGPSEAHAVTSLTLKGDPEDWPDLPSIGWPLSNTRIYLLDEHLRQVPIGVAGELYVGGVQVGRGYLGRPDLTAERFLPDPFSTEPGARLYRTGDQARYRAEGELEFLGRGDSQVKVRGFRIELGEVEAALAKHPAVRDCIVDARDDGAGQKRLVAWVIGVEGQRPEPGAMRAFLKQRLPEYMLPALWVPLESFPLTPSGKVDRKALPVPEGSREASRAFVGPRTPLELRLVRIWEEVLGVQPVGVRDNFFELGGHSLLTLRLQSAIRAKLGRPLPVTALFQNPTVEHLAKLLHEDTGPWSPLVELQAGDGRRPFFCVHPVGGSVLPYAELARRLGVEQPFYGLQARGLDGDEALLESIPDMAKLYVTAMRVVQPRGPYLLGGWSMGGAIAFEMASQLQREGEEVALLALIDATADLQGDERKSEQPEAALRELFFEDLLRAAGQPMPALEGKSPEARLRALEEASQAFPYPTLRRVFENNLRAAWAYAPPPYAGPVTLFVARESRWDHGWASRTPGGLTTHEVPGDHYSMLTRPHVETLAARLAECLEKARARAESVREVVRTG